MAEDFSVPPADDVSDNDKLMSALSYPIFLVAIVILLSEDMKARPFQKYHAVQALAANIALAIIVIVTSCILGAITFFIGGLCGLLPLFLWFALLYWGYEAYQGKYFEIPWLTEFLKKQGWL